MNFALSVIAKTTILLACASLMTLALRRASASARHAVWAIALLSALILPIASRFLPEVALPVLPEETFEAATPLLLTGTAESRPRTAVPGNPTPPRRSIKGRQPVPTTRPSIAASETNRGTYRVVPAKPDSSPSLGAGCKHCPASPPAGQLLQFADSGGIPFALMVPTGPISWTI